MEKVHYGLLIPKFIALLFKIQETYTNLKNYCIYMHYGCPYLSSGSTGKNAIEQNETPSICFISQELISVSKPNPNLPCFPLILETRRTLTFLVFLSFRKTEKP